MSRSSTSPARGGCPIVPGPDDAPVPQAAVDDLIELLDLEPIEVNIFRGVEPRREAAARVRRAGRGPGVGGRGAHRRPGRLVACTRCTPTSCGRATRRCRSSTRSTASATAARSPPGGWWRCSTAARSSTCRRRSTCTRRASTTSSRSPTTSRRPSRSPTSEPLGAVGRQARRLVRAPAPDRHALRRLVTARPRRAAAAPPAGLDPGRRQAARRPGAAHLRAHLRVGHDPARHHDAGPRRPLARGPGADGEPRPRDVVPPAVPGRRVAAVRPGLAVDLRRARAGSWADLDRRRTAGRVGRAGRPDQADRG